MCIKIIASLCDNKIDIMPRLILLLCVLHVWRYSQCEQGQLLSNNDYLFAIGNGKLMAASWLTDTLTISLDGYSVSSACGSHPSRCRELLTESIETSNFTSKHIILIPLESGVQIFELAYNSTSSNQLSLVAQYRLLFSRINGNHSCRPSLGVYKLGSDYFTPCIGTDDQYYVCELILNLTAITQSTLQPCRQANINVSETRVPLSSISNTVVANERLIFLVQNVLYELYPRSSSNTPFTYDAFLTYCSSVSQLLMSPQHKNQLLVYCQNQNTIVYDLSLHSITRTEGMSNIPYPCSPTAEYIVHLSQTQMEFSYKLNGDGDTVIRIFESPTMSMNFYSGACFESVRGNHLFVYVDTSVGAYLFNATSENLWFIPNTLGCLESECELPLVYSNRYIVIRNKLRRNVTVFDTLFNRSIVNLGDVPLQLITFISDLPAISLRNVTPISTIVYKGPIDSSTDQNQNDIKGGVPLELEVVVPVAILSILIVIILIAIIVILVIIIKRCCSGGIRMDDNGSYELDVNFIKQGQEVVIENCSILESQPIKTVAAKLEIEADNDSSYSNPVYSGESFDDHKEMPASVIVFENQVTSDSSSVDHDVGIQYPQNNPREQTIADLSNSETQTLIEPIKAGSENDNLNVTASLEDNNPSSDNQGEVIINIHALNNSLDNPKVDSQAESQPVPSTDQLLESGESLPSLNPQFNTEREEQTVGNGASSKLSTSADQEFVNGGQINDDTKERESEGDASDKSTEHTETRDPPPPLNIHTQLSAGREDQTVDTVTPSELSPSSDQEFEGGGSINDDNEDRESEGDRNDKLRPSDEPTSEALIGEEKQASSELLLSTDHHDAAHIIINDIGGGESGNEDSEGNYGQKRENPQMINQSLGSPNETDSSVLESDDHETAQSHDINYMQCQECTPLDTVFPKSLPESGTVPASAIEFPPLQEDLSNSKDKEKECTNTESENPPEDEVISPSTDKLLGHTSETAVKDVGSNMISLPNTHRERTDSNPFIQKKEENCEEDTPMSDVVHPTDTTVALTFPIMLSEIEATSHQDEYHTRDPSSVHHEEVEGSLEPPEEINEVEENISQTSNRDEFEVVDQEGTGDHLETKEANRDEGDDKQEFQALAKESKHVIDQEDIGDHLLETEEGNGDKIDDSKQGDHLETEEVNGDKGEDNGNAFSQSLDSLSVVVDQDNIENQSRVLVDAANEKHTPAYQGSSANSEKSLTSSSIMSTSRQSDDDEVLSSKSPASTESDLDISLSSQEDVCKEKEAGYSNSTEADNPEIFSANTVADQEGKHNNTEAQADAECLTSNELLVKSQEDVLVVSNSSNESYEEISPIKCTFVGRTIKTVIRTSAESNTSRAKAETFQGENHVSIFSKSHPPLKLSDIEDSESFNKNSNEEIAAMKTSMVVENGNDSSFSSKTVSWNLGTPIKESKFGSMNDETLTQRVTNKTLPHLEGANSMEFASQERKKAEAIEPEQKFPYKFETVV